MVLLKAVLLTILIIGIGHAQIDEAQEKLDELGKKFGDPSLASKLNVSEVNATIGRVNDVFKQKCLQNANMDAYEKTLAAKDKLMECVKGIVNVTRVQEEIEEATPKGELDEVFKKYCMKSPQGIECLHDFTRTLEECLTPKERANMKIVHNITDSLVNFICFKEGERIALFIAESGQECLQEHQEEIQSCVNTTYGTNVDTEKLSLDNIPELDFDAENCGKMVVLEECVVKALNKCSQPTPANIAESLFKYVRQVTPCNNIINAKLDATAHGVISQVHVAVVAFMFATYLFTTY